MSHDPLAGKQGQVSCHPSTVREGSGKTLLNLIGHGHTKKLETGRTQGKWYFKIVECLAAALSSWSHNWSPCRLNFNEVLDLVESSRSRFIDGTEKVSNFSSFWIAMEPSQLQWLKKVFCFLFMEKVGFRKVSERFFGGILFCWFDSWPLNFPTFLFIYSSYVQTTRLNPKPVLWRKKTISDNF